jgi:signal transduction histidine kinase
LPSLLIVDDDLGLRNRLVEILQSTGYGLHIHDGHDAAAAALRDPVNADLDDPVALIGRWAGGVSGIEVISRLLSERPDLVCVLIAADIDARTAINALRHGAYDCFDAADDLSQLTAVLTRCFARVAQNRERAAAFEALRLSKEAAERANQGKSGFLATMSHELRTPLNAIIGFSEMMIREVWGALGNAQYRDYVADIHQSGTHLLHIINDILDLSKAESGKLELDEEVFDPKDVVRSAMQLLSPRFHAGELTVSLELPNDLPPLRADERKTKQVLLNLLSNAVKFTAPGGSVLVSARFDRRRGLTITVADTGIGIAPNDLARVLEPFEQVDSPLNRTKPGTGLGLPLVKAIMELHGGQLELRSKLGAGTRVSATFPAQRAIRVGKARNAA